MLPAATSPPRLVTLVVLTALSVLSLNLFVPSLAAMAAEFEVDYAVMALAIAGYLGVTAGLMLVMGPLSDRIGRRPVMLAGMALFALASIVCALANDIWLFLVFRAVQGDVICGWALSLAIVGDTAPPREAASRIGYVTMAMAVVPMLGPMVGGALDQFFGWRASFACFAVLGLAAFLLCWLDLGETNTRRCETFGRQLRALPALLSQPLFWGFAVCMAASTGAFYAFLAGAPLVAVEVLGLSPAVLGVAMGTITAGFALGSFLSGRLARHHRLTSLMTAGRLVACAGLVLGLMLFLVGLAHPLSFFGAAVFVGLGNGLTTPSCSSGVMSVRPELAGSASGLAGALTVGGGALVTSATGAAVGVEYGIYVLLGIMLALSLLGLAAVVFVRRRVGPHAASPGVV